MKIVSIFCMIHQALKTWDNFSIFCMVQQAQKHVETTLKEMMDQKNKMAYENGRLQTQLEQTTLELEALRKLDLDTNKYKTLADTLANKYGGVSVFNINHCFRLANYGSGSVV